MKGDSGNDRLTSSQQLGARTRFLQLPLLTMLVWSAVPLFIGCSHTHGLKMTPERTAFIQNGITTRTEVIETLGPPLYELGPERIIAYAWETESNVTTYYTALGSYHEFDKSHSSWLYCVHFDERNNVARSGKIRQLDTESYTEAIMKWLQSKGK
jgi:hypothetical protein